MQPRIVLNTRSDNAASRVGIHGLARRLRDRGIEANVGDWGNYDCYDVAVFLGYDFDLERAKAQNPTIRVALVDPKLSKPHWLEAAREADFLMVSSIEQRDAFLRVNRNVLVYYMFPVIDANPRVHADGKTFIIGYHGNRVHLETMVAHVRPALEELGRRRKVELRVVYNVRDLGRATIGLPDTRFVTVRHIQWSDDFADNLRAADVGIVPNELPIRDRQRILQESAFDEPQFAYESLDHLVRFKLSSNPGRIFPFAQLEIPVVVDFTPSASQFVLDGSSGFVASSAHGWFEALDTLASSAALRARMGGELRRRMQAAYDGQVDQFLDWCCRPLSPNPVYLEGATTAEDELAHLGAYRGPTAPLTWRRVRERLSPRRFVKRLLD